MKKLTLLTAFILTCATASFAQVVELPTDYVRNTRMGLNDLPANVKGSPYLNENFQKGKVTINDNTFGANVRYNALNDVFEIKTPKGALNSLVRRPDIKITIGNDEYEIFNFRDNNSEKQRYFKILADGDTKFLKIEGMELKESRAATSSYGQDTPASLVPYEKYYIKKDGASAVEVRLKKRKVLKLFDDPRVEAYVKDNKLRLKEENELVQLINYYNTL